MKIHKIFSKRPSDPWKIFLGERLNTDTDSRDYDPSVVASNSTTLQTTYSTIFPYKAITYLNPQFVGFDRKYIDDNTLDLFWEFNLPDNTDANTFAISYLTSIHDITNPVVNNYMNYISTNPNGNPTYHVVVQIEDDQGNISNFN